MNNNRSIIIGLTGMSGAGKSTACRLFSELGYDVIDCDKVSRDVVEKGRPALREIADEFGREYINEGGTLNRRKLGSLVFSDSDKRLKLNSIIYPYIIDEVMRTVNHLVDNGSDRILIDAPTLFESGLDSACDYIVSVVADIDDCIGRITARDNITEKQAKDRLSSQFSAEFYDERSDYCVKNDGSVDDLKRKIREISERLGEIHG